MIVRGEWRSAGPPLLAAAALALFLGPAAPPRADIRLVSLQPVSFDTGPELPLRGSPARIDFTGNRLIFPQHAVQLWVQFDPPGAPKGSFVINGLTYPEVEVRAGARLVVTFLNESAHGAATFAIVNRGPPFPDLPVDPDPYKLSFRQHLPGFVGAVSYPPPRDRAHGFTVYGARLVYQLRSAGRAWYLSNFPGAANSGEYGVIQVVP